MNVQDEVLSFMDLLDLDEEIIDARLKSLMQRHTFTVSHLNSVIYLLQYKNLINIQEGTECGNDEEYNFIAKLINDVDVRNVDSICKIIKIVLCLNITSLVNKSEHLLQQILLNINLSSKLCQDISDNVDGGDSSETLLKFKLCESILEAAITNGQKLSLLFLETPIEHVLSSNCEKLKVHFLKNTVPKLFEGIAGYNILDCIWEYTKSKRLKENALKMLSCLSDFFLPVPDDKGNLKFESTIVSEYEFWDILLFGLMSYDVSVRKIAVYLIKRAIDCTIALKTDILVQSDTETLWQWETNNTNVLKQTWDNFFILIDSVEEKQSNIVLPSLRLFEKLNGIQSKWISCIYNIGLKHDNTQVRLKCIEHRLNTEIETEAEAVILLEAFNDINLFDHAVETESLKQKLAEAFKNKYTSVCLLKAVAKVNWSPVPYYHFTNVLANLKLDGDSHLQHLVVPPDIIINMLKMSCNHTVLRKASHINISYFIGNSCNTFSWKDVVNIYTLLKFDKQSFQFRNNNPFFITIKEKLTFNNEEKLEFLKFAAHYKHTDFALLYLENHDEDLGIFLDIINDKIRKVQDVVNRQYCNKMECLADVIFLIDMYRKTSKGLVNLLITREAKTILHYILGLLSNDENPSIEALNLLFKHSSMSLLLQDENAKDIILELYKSSVLIIKEKETVLDKKVTAIFILTSLIANEDAMTDYKHEMLGIKQILDIFKNMNFKEIQNIENNGRLRNVFYEKSCEILLVMIDKTLEVENSLNEIIDFIGNVTECGGYGCLKWILKIVNKILNEILNNDNINFDLTLFINRMWKEIEELKSNNQYNPCMQEFVKLITHDAFLKQAQHNNTVIIYCNKIIEYGPLKNAPLYYLAKSLKDKHITTDHGQIIYVLCEILLYAPVPRKDLRITENVEVEIMVNSKYTFDNQQNDMHFNFQIQYFSIATLTKIINTEIFDIVIMFIKNRIEETFNKKQRYHGNSQTHRTLLAALQHLLLTVVLKNFDIRCFETWSIKLLGRLPHQPSIRICLEWLISLCFCTQNINISEEVLHRLKLGNVPITSQFIVLFWTMKYKISIGSFNKKEYEFIMDTLLSHTMGQMFNIRLYGQYLATELYKLKKDESSKYDFVIQIIEKTFEESCKDKNFLKLKDDFFINEFDVVSHLTPSFIFYFLPRYCEINSNESIDHDYIKSALKDINQNIRRPDREYDFMKTWLERCKTDEEVFGYIWNRFKEIKILDDVGSNETIQKKYIPWKNMSDIDVYDSGKKRQSSSELIVVASLIDKLPNLGGMARTSEVFGVKTYVVDSLRHLQDKQFQGLSVSAERWVNIQEVRPGLALKEYLMRKKADGYSVVAAEQTSTSSKLQSFKFPKKTLLLLGHEKEGVPCDLLPIMDFCVEIPQQGFVRSLNVHVTAAIFIWEYARQNIL